MPYSADFDFVDYYYGGPAVASAIWLIVVIILMVIAAIVGQILLGLAVYHNAKSRSNPNPGMWGLLSGFFGWIPALIYFVTRDSTRNRLIVCPQCKAPHPVSYPNCPQCGVQNGYAQQFVNPYTEQEAKLSKKLLIAAIVVVGASIIALIISIIVFVATAASYYYYY